MKQCDVVLGETVLTYVGPSLVRVKVLREERNYKGKLQYVVAREDNGQQLPKWRTAAALRLAPQAKLWNTTTKILSEKYRQLMEEIDENLHDLGILARPIPQDCTALLDQRIELQNIRIELTRAMGRPSTAAEAGLLRLQELQLSQKK